jgi:membrane-associated phospholipid phosphatase
MTRKFKAWFASFLVIAVFSFLSVLWLDKPTAFLVHDAFGKWTLPDGITRSQGFSIPLTTAAVFVMFGLAAIMGRKFSKLEMAVLFCDISILAADAIKNQLKFIFGRTWPDSWDPEILSLIRDDAYGFHFFHSGPSFESFPSGHAAVVSAAMAVLWIVFPRLRALCVLLIGAADAGLILLNLHFVSDVVAGTFVGLSTGMFTLALCGPRQGEVVPFDSCR